MDLGQVQVMEFPWHSFAKKMTGFPSDLVSFSNQTKRPSKRHEKIPVTFFTGLLLKLLFLLLSLLFLLLLLLL